MKNKRDLVVNAVRRYLEHQEFIFRRNGGYGQFVHEDGIRISYKIPYQGDMVFYKELFIIESDPILYWMQNELDKLLDKWTKDDLWAVTITGYRDDIHYTPVSIADKSDIERGSRYISKRGDGTPKFRYVAKRNKVRDLIEHLGKNKLADRIGDKIYVDDVDIAKFVKSF